MRSEFESIKNQIVESSKDGWIRTSDAVNIVMDVAFHYQRDSEERIRVSEIIKDLVYAKKSCPGTLAPASIDKAIDLITNILDFTWIPVSSGELPEENKEVDVTIMEEIPNEPDRRSYRTETSWIQDGQWVVRKTPLNPKVIAWKRKSMPYVPKGGFE